MKTFRLTFFLAVFTLLFSNTAFAQKQKTVETATIKTVIYCDHCKVCETCGPKFEKTLLKEKGVQMVTLDEKAMTIKVVYNTKKTFSQCFLLSIVTFCNRRQGFHKQRHRL